ncbi:MAG: sulfatase-like hydrolase/transferase [Firmicutes bacterium]|nr:sulfatase-like hydrolase/transferase [Bacillota bacterium]
MTNQNEKNESISDISESEKPHSKPSPQSDESKSSEAEALLTAKKKNNIMSKIYFLFIPISLLFMELLVKFLISGSIFDRSLIYILLFSLSYGCLLSAICGAFCGVARRTLTKITLFLLGAFMAFQLGYYKNFQCHFDFASAGEAQNALTDFSSLILYAAQNIWYAIILLMLPLVIFWIFGKKFAPNGEKNITVASVSAAASVIIYFCALWVTVCTGFENGSDGYTYKYAQNDIEITYNTFGIITTSRLNIKQMIFGVPEEPFLIPEVSQVDQEVSPSDIEYGYNILDIDFEKLAENETDKTIKSMHQYVAAQQPTLKNEYTGLFEGKNLIMMTLEGFSSKIIDPEFTPMLYKMANEGFVFNNYYHQSSGGSTASGEYTNLTGNIYHNTSCLEKSGTTYQPFSIANQLSKKGYSCYAYHNNTSTYYRRNISHPNFGYQWKAPGNGLIIKKNWPTSDLEMAEVSVDEYINNQPFHAYYMTFSGHASYSTEYNAMSRLHLDDLPEKYKNYPGRIRCYLACQYEVELMLQHLVSKLDEAGILDDTVFVMMPDHYPYAMEERILAQLYNIPEENIRNNVELYKNSFIIWSSSMEEPVVVDKTCSAIDILPTLLNLWGIDYDSRIMIGADIFSNKEAIAPVKTQRYSWVTDQGSYNYSNGKFTPKSDCTLTEEQIDEYVSRINQIIKSKIDFSIRVLDNNYYSYIPGI